MELHTRFKCGDLAWICCPVQLITIGLVRVEVIDSKGLGVGDDVADNFKAQFSYKEEYMALETGIGSGSVYTLGVHIFASETEARIAAKKAQK